MQETSFDIKDFLCFPRNSCSMMSLGTSSTSLRSLLRKQFSSPEPVVSWSRGRERRGRATGRLQIKPSGSGDENVRRPKVKEPRMTHCAGLEMTVRCNVKSYNVKTCLVAQSLPRQYKSRLFSYFLQSLVLKPIIDSFSLYQEIILRFWFFSNHVLPAFYLQRTQMSEKPRSHLLKVEIWRTIVTYFPQDSAQ